MKFKKSPRKGTLVVELNSENNRLINSEKRAITALKEILVPLDFSECSKHALQYAIAFARQFDARITLLSVVPDDPTDFDVANSDYLTHLEARKKVYARELSKVAEDELGKVRCGTVVRSGKAYEEIVTAARNLNTDLIVISTHGRRALPQAAMLGSTAERVIRHAPCPVLVVREKQRDFASPAGV